MTDETVTVPRELLAVVLASAEANLPVIEKALGCKLSYDKARITELRKAAGLEEGDD